MICDRTLKVLNICQQIVPLSPPPTSPEYLPLLPFLHPSLSSHTQIDAHQDDANAVTFADESSQLIFSGGDDGICKVWDRRTLSETHCNPVGILAGHKDGITFIDTKVCLPPHSHTHLLTQYSVRCHANTHAHTCTHSHKSHPHIHTLISSLDTVYVVMQTHTHTHALTHSLVPRPSIT